MKKVGLKMIALITLTSTGVIIGLSGCKQESAQNNNQNTNQAAQPHTVQYTCSMHPDVVQDKPGNCPKCGMQLVEKH